VEFTRKPGKVIANVLLNSEQVETLSTVLRSSDQGDGAVLLEVVVPKRGIKRQLRLNGGAYLHSDGEFATYPEMKEDV